MRRLVVWALAFVLTSTLLGMESPGPAGSTAPSRGATGEGSTMVLDADNSEPVRANRRRRGARRKAVRRGRRRVVRRGRRRAVRRSWRRRGRTVVARRHHPPPPPPAPPPQPGPSFTSSVQAVDPARVPHSWRPGCPVPLDHLRLLTLDHWGFDGAVHRGELVVHGDQVNQVLTAMRMLFEGRFPIERMQLVDVYGGNDDASMAANNTSAFNCRSVSGRTGVWSQHAYGWAIDINPVQNPYVSGGSVSPPAGAPFASRSARHPGMVHAGVVNAFASVGWGWGGHWRSPKDYQHFSATGR